MQLFRRLVLVVALPLILPALAEAQRGSYDPSDDWLWSLGDRDGVSTPVSLDASGFPWPELPAGTDTLLLEIEIDAGKRDPSITARGGPLETVQYFDARGRGRRYLELSAFAGVLSVGQELELTGDRVEWSEGPATLHAFDNRPIESRRVLVLAPHPDDAEIAAYGVYATSDADVVTVTAGDAGGRNFRVLWPDDAEHFEVKGKIRTWDSVTIPLLAGLDPGRARNLGFYDATLRDLWQRRPERIDPPFAELEDPAVYRRVNIDPELRSRPLVPTWQGLVDDLRRELARVEPEVVVAPSPDLDGHADHQFATIAMVEALEAHGDPAVEVYLYTNHPYLEEVFPWGPRDGVMTLWPWRGPRLEASRVHSVQLDEQTRKQKLVALEAMHDLRDFDLDSPPAPSRGAARRSRERLDYSYYRRGARPNEIFLVLTVEQARQMRDRFLAAFPQATAQATAARAASE